MRVLILPIVDKQSDLDDLLCRLAFYLSPVKNWEITVAVAPGLSVPDPGQVDRLVPEDMDPRIPRLLRQLLPKVTIVGQADLESTFSAGAGYDAVFVREAGAGNREPWRSILSSSKVGHVYPVDPTSDRMEGSQYIEAVFRHSEGKGILKEDSRIKLQKLLGRIGVRQAAYLLGTGPSISDYDRYSYHDGVVIACNTIVLNDELWAHTQPEVLTFADPIFHFGCSQYAAEFRRRVRERSKEFDFSIVIPIKYYELFTALEPSLAKRTIGITFSQREINLDLRAESEVKVIDNIATFLMMPLGATLARSIRFIGFDGRGQGEQYFWRHNPRTQLHELMENIKKVHPGFFKIEYADYYKRHCENLAAYIQCGERVGKEFVSLTPSAIPALAERPAGGSELHGAHWRIEDASRPAFRVLALSPDWIDDFGHYAHHDRRLSQAIGALGGELVSLTHRDLPQNSEERVFNSHRVFSENSWHPLRAKTLGCVGRFEEELSAFLTGYAEADSSTPTVIAMYTGTPWHIGALSRVNVRFADMPWGYALNLFFMFDTVLRMEEDESKEEKGLRAARVSRSVRPELDVQLFADTEYLRRSLEKHMGERVQLWPMFSTSFGVDEVEGLVKQGMKRPSRLLKQGMKLRSRLRVYAPGTVQFAKGYDLLLGLSRARTRADRKAWDLVVRAVLRTGTPSELVDVVKELRRTEHALEGVLQHSDYVRALVDSDIVLIPYRVNPFRARTSAVFSDAIMLGKPVVATRGTWAGEFVQSMGVGETFDDGSAKGMLEAIRRVVRDIESYRSRVMVERESWAKEHDASRLAELLQGLATEEKRASNESAPIFTVDECCRQIERLASPHRVR